MTLVVSDGCPDCGVEMGLVLLSIGTSCLLGPALIVLVPFSACSDVCFTFLFSVLEKCKLYFSRIH